METAQLSYFLLACQFKNQAEAAAYANVAAATVSENIDALERELGMTLFQRGPRGHYPTEAARWLYQSVEPLLQAVEAAETILRADPATWGNRRSGGPESQIKFLKGGCSPIR